MDEVVKKAIQTTESKRRPSVPWKFDEPWKQPVHIYSSDQHQWQRFETASAVNILTSSNTAIVPARLALYAWNIDFMLPFPDSRMHAAIRHLESLVQGNDENTASVIYLQECVESDLKLLAADGWIQRTFTLSDTGIGNWQSGHYGTCTLIDRRLPITRCFRVHYSQTRMERDGLFVDVLLGKDSRVMRLCNTHLESLAFDPPYRPPQMEICTKYMREPSLHGAAVAGDFNAIQPFDKHLHSDNELKDAFLELGGSENDAIRGHTWGQQAATSLRDKFGTSRMDKVFYCGDVPCVAFERFGADVELQDEGERTQIVQFGFDKPWITDHLGVKAVFKLQDETAAREYSL